MVLTDAKSVELELRSKEPCGVLLSGNALIIAALTSTLAVPHPTKALSDQPRYFSHLAEGSYKGVPLQAASATKHRVRITPKTQLGKRLNELRNKAIAKGIPLLDADEILIEVQKRRGELD